MSMRRTRRVGLLFMAVAACSLSTPSAAQECRDGSNIKPKIVGGEPARIRHWPGQAILRTAAQAGKNSLYFCGASAISDRWVLTAAHCVDDIKADLTKSFSDRAGKAQVGTVQIVIGVEDLDKVGDENVYEVEKIVMREGYSEASASGRDIALINLKRPYGGPIARLSLDGASDPPTPPGAQVRVAGFGSLKFRAPTNTYRRPDGQEYSAGSKRLLEATLPTVGGDQCKARYPKSKIDEEQLCAGLEQGGRDSCQGDSGGPLVAYDLRGCPYQIGVVSWGAGCAGAKDYGVYTRVSYHADWLKSFASVKGVAPADLQAPSGASAVASAFTEQAKSQLEDVLADAKGRVKISLKNGNTVKLGDEVVFVVRSDVAGRLVVVDINAAGEVVQLLPNKFTPAHQTARVAAGADLTIPGAGYGFTGFKAIEPVGKGKLIALVVPDSFPADALVDVSNLKTKGFAPVSTPTNYLMNLVQQVVAAVSGRSATDTQLANWGLGTTEYEITK